MKKYIVVFIILFFSSLCYATFFPWNLNMRSNSFSLPDVSPCWYLKDEEGNYLVDENGDYIIGCPNANPITIDSANVTINGATINIYE